MVLAHTLFSSILLFGYYSNQLAIIHVQRCPEVHIFPIFHQWWLLCIVDMSLPINKNEGKNLYPSRIYQKPEKLITVDNVAGKIFEEIMSKFIFNHVAFSPMKNWLNLLIGNVLD